MVPVHHPHNFLCLPHFLAQGVSQMIFLLFLFHWPEAGVASPLHHRQQQAYPVLLPAAWFWSDSNWYKIESNTSSLFIIF